MDAHRPNDLVTRLRKSIPHTDPSMCSLAMAEAAAEIEQLRNHVNAMCGWAELLAEERDWTRANAAAYWAAYDAARAAAKVTS